MCFVNFRFNELWNGLIDIYKFVFKSCMLLYKWEFYLLILIIILLNNKISDCNIDVILLVKFVDFGC